MRALALVLLFAACGSPVDDHDVVDADPAAPDALVADADPLAPDADPFTPDATPADASPAALADAAGGPLPPWSDCDVFRDDECQLGTTCMLRTMFSAVGWCKDIVYYTGLGDPCPLGAHACGYAQVCMPMPDAVCRRICNTEDPVPRCGTGTCWQLAGRTDNVGACFFP